MMDVFGGSPYAFWDLAASLDDPKAQLDAYERGIAAEPECLAMYAGAVNLAEYFELGRSLAKEFPDFFDDDARWVLGEQDPRNWARRAGELAFRKHYEKLGWKWALALCDLRA